MNTSNCEVIDKVDPKTKVGKIAGGCKEGPINQIN